MQGNNTRQAKNEAYAVATRIKEHFPELTVYTSFNPPRWLCRAGDFRSIEEADAMMRQLRATGVFEGSFYRERADKHPLIKNYHVRKRRNCISFIR